MRAFTSISIWLIASGLTLGCSFEKAEPDAASGSGADEKNVAIKAQKVTFELSGSWLMKVAEKPADLVALAESNEGWGHFFSGDIRSAHDAFREQLSTQSSRVGAARSALALAEAHKGLSDILVGAATRLNDAQLSSVSVTLRPWLQLVNARLAEERGDDPSAVLKALGDDPAVGPWAKALMAPESKLGMLLRGKSAGLEASVPATGTSAYEKKLRVRAYARSGDLAKAMKIWRRIKFTRPDFRVDSGDGEAGFYDPATADVGMELYALLALDYAREQRGWFHLWAARAHILLKNWKGALGRLDKLLAKPPSDVALAELCLSPELGRESLIEYAQVLRARVLVALGQKDEARAILGKLSGNTLGQSVRRVWGESFLGAGTVDAFPKDSTFVLKALREQIKELAPDARGGGDLAELALPQRYVDVTERRFASALLRMNRPALAVKHRGAAEDKHAAYSPSRRNTLVAVVSAANDNLAVERPRVALKYLSRMMKRLPAAGSPAELLRDLLSVRALQYGSGVQSGQ